MKTAATKLLVVFALLPTGCAGTTDPTAPELTQEEPSATDGALSYTIELNRGHSLQYRVLRDGSMVVAETGDLESDAPAVERLGVDLGRPLDVFRALRPNQEIPAELLQLDALANQVREPAVDEELDGDAFFSPGQSESGIDKHATSSADHFKGTHFGCFFAFTDVLRGCITNWTGGDAHAFGTARWAIYKFAAVRGSVIPVIFVNGNLFRIDTVSEGQFRWFWARAGLEGNFNGAAWPVSASHFLAVTDAAGDEIHFSARLHNLKYGSASCAEVSNTPASSRGVSACASHYGEVGDPP